MIFLIAGLAWLQVAAPADPPSAITVALVREMDACLAAQVEPAAPHGPGRNYDTLDGGRLLGRHGRDNCHILADDWTPQGDQAARTVETALRSWTPGFTITRWREPFANESGLSVWTAFDQLNAEGRRIGSVLLIEPADGARGELNLTYRAARPQP